MDAIVSAISNLKINRVEKTHSIYFIACDQTLCHVRLLHFCNKYNIRNETVLMMHDRSKNTIHSHGISSIFSPPLVYTSRKEIFEMFIWTITVNEPI